MLHSILIKLATTAISKTSISPNTIMYYSSRSFLSMAAATLAVASTSTSNAFVQKSLPSASARHYSSASTTLNMVADDAKVIMVTGSSRGLGRSIAMDIGAHGHKMIINYVSDGSKESADATVEAIKASGGDAIAIQADCKLSLIHI